MDGADQLIIRYALSQRRAILPKDLADQIDNPTWSAQDLIDALHERANRDPELARAFLQLLNHHPPSAEVTLQRMNGGLKPPGALTVGGAAVGASGTVQISEQELLRQEASKALQMKRESLVVRVEEAFFPATEAQKRIDLDLYVKLMQALELAKSLKGLKGVERELNRCLRL